MLKYKQFESKLSNKFLFNVPLFKIAKEIANKLGYKFVKYLAHGHFGYAFKLNNNKVIKITSDTKEINFVKKNINKKTYSTVNFHNIIKIDKRYVKLDSYAIILDYITPITDNEKDIYYKLFIEFKYSTNIINGDINSYNNNIKEKMKDFFNDYEISFIEELLDLFYRGQKDGIDTFDQHPENIGRKDKLYFLDIN